MRIAIAAAITCLSIIGVTATAQVHAAVRKHTEIPPESLDMALRTLAKDRGFQLVYLTESVATLETRGAVGDLTVDEALKKLLSDSRLEYKFVDDNTVSIFPRSNPTSGLSGERIGRDGEPASVSKRSAEEGIRLAQVDQRPTSGSPSVDGSPSNSQDNAKASVGLSEIIVTAQKRSERLQDTPVPVTVINPDTLSESNIVLLQEYFSTVPGFTDTPSVEGASFLSIRGTTTGGFENPTVGVVIDDVPFGGQSNQSIPDIDPADLSQIEVLRGPQGTLYGADSLGGLLKYVTASPSTAGYSGHIEAGTNSVHNGNEPGYSVRASANVPLTDEFAFRISGFERQDPGYINNPQTNQKGVNEVQNYGGRLSALWTPTDSVNLRINALVQTTDSAGVPWVVVTPGLGDLDQNFIPNTGKSRRELEAYSAILNVKIGSATLTSLTGYNQHKYNDNFDVTSLFGGLTNQSFGTQFPGIDGSAFYNDFAFTRITEEARLSVPLLDRLDLLVGAFFSHEHDTINYGVLAQDQDTGTVVGSDFTGSLANITTDYAVFSDLTYRVTDRFTLQLGGRESFDKYVAPAVTPGSQRLESSDSSFTYLLTPEYHFSKNAMLYARFASGFRPGAPNTPGPGVPTKYEPDTTHNYEVGFKAGLLDNRLFVDSSIYYIDWRKIQLFVFTDALTPYQTNGSAAKSDGVETSVTANPAAGLTVQASFSYDHAVLTRNLPLNSTVEGVTGDRLPNTPEWSTYISAEQSFPLPNSTKGIFGASFNYVGGRFDVFQPAGAERLRFPSYTKINFHLTFINGDWRTNLYANNVADSRGVLGGNLDNLFPNAFIYTTPRTVGVNVAKSF